MGGKRCDDRRFQMSSLRITLKPTIGQAGQPPIRGNSTNRLRVGRSFRGRPKLTPRQARRQGWKFGESGNNGQNARTRLSIRNISPGLPFVPDDFAGVKVSRSGPGRWSRPCRTNRANRPRRYKATAVNRVERSRPAVRAEALADFSRSGRCRRSSPRSRCLPSARGGPGARCSGRR